MRRLIRWVLVAVIAAGAGWVLRLTFLERAGRRRLAVPPSEPWPDPPGRDGPAPHPPAGAPVAADPPAGAGRAWVAPLDGGACPSSHPVKAKLRSRVFHLPGMAAYGRTGADRCYATPEAAEADGFRCASR